MGAPDTAAKAVLAAPVILPAFIGWFDVLGDPLRVTTWGASLSFSGTGDADLDGETFDALDPVLVSVGTVKHQEGGSETLNVSLSGLMGPDTGLMNIIGDKANWQGRIARLWLGIYDADRVQQGAVWSYYTGRMSSVSLRGDVTSQTIEVQIENYLAAISSPSNRTYLDQERYDAGDLSARAAIAIANGTTGGAAATPMIGGGSGLLDFVQRQYIRTV